MSDGEQETGPRQCRRFSDKNGWGWKRRYDTRADALAAGPGQDVYPCPHCGFWHRASALPEPKTLTVNVSYRPGKLPRIEWHR